MQLKALTKIAKENNIPFERLLKILGDRINYSGILSNGHPRILFEREKFRELTGAVYDLTHPNLSGRSSEDEYRYGAAEWSARFEKAKKLNPDAAIMATKFGIGQIYGYYYKECGCSSLQEFVNKNFESEESQIVLFINFINHEKNLGTRTE